MISIKIVFKNLNVMNKRGYFNFQTFEEKQYVHQSKHLNFLSALFSLTSNVKHLIFDGAK